MKLLTKIAAGGVLAVGLIAAAPASAQYYPGYGYGGGGVVQQVLGQVLGGGYGGYGSGYGNYGYGMNSQAAVSQCTNAVQARLGGYNGYGYNGGYGGYSQGRVLGISRVEPRSSGGLTIRGVATSGRYGGYGYNGQAPVDLTFKCKADYRGFITDVDIDRTSGSYGYNSQPYAAPYSPYGTDYSAYGYRRY